ncbi:TonB-dependent receptor [Adhaeribacter terrigena]|uniref:TonB-dependent receptor n=1 Tax=Adhaeribacter terrigena TaxID=2793070 RepID=UPI001F1BD6EF|nr:carboxypeptidase-like regulatory domain-containing protein [Adhaeribacter terrigena]
MLLILLFPAVAFTQNLNGQVFDRSDKNTVLPGASLVWAGTTSGTLSDSKGTFTLPFSTQTNKLVISFIGYKPDTITVKPKELFLRVYLEESGSLQEVEITAKQDRFDAKTPIKTEIITSRDLEKSACCNLAESFETNASVEVSTTDAVSGAKQIQMLGLDGAYTLLTTDNVPALQGLATPFRLNYLSGTYIDNIDIIKGTGSVLNGYESISGQVNVKLKDPEKADRVFVNLYGNDLGKWDANLNVGHSFSEKLSTVLMLHTAQLHNRVDRNDDGFMDQPLGTQYNVYNKWKYTSGRFVSEVGLNALRENRIGGQTSYKEGSGAASGNYGTESLTDRVSGYTKLSLTSKNKPYESLGLILSGSNHKFDSEYGFRNYDGEQQSALARFIFQSAIGTTAHTYKLGASFGHENLRENFEDTLMTRKEYIPGIFGEYTYNNAHNLTVVAGARTDFHNLYGTVFTPRLHVKYDLNPNNIFRISGGKGFRVANPIAENSGALVSSRRFIFQEKLQPEEAWNTGGSFTRYFTLGGKPGTFIADYYYTTFQNQVVADMYSVPEAVIFTNLEGRSFSNSFQAEVQYELAKGLDVKAAYKYFDVKSSYEGKLMDRPMNPKNRFFVNAGYATAFDKWRFDATVQWFGNRSLPTIADHAGNVETNRTADPFSVLNSQVTRSFKHWDIYVGGENLLNFKQKDPIMNADQPFSHGFDASMVWGPISGRVIYAGLRYKLK